MISVLSEIGMLPKTDNIVYQGATLKSLRPAPRILANCASRVDLLPTPREAFQTRHRSPAPNGAQHRPAGRRGRDSRLRRQAARPRFLGKSKTRSEALRDTLFPSANMQPNCRRSLGMDRRPLTHGRLQILRRRGSYSRARVSHHGLCRLEGNLDQLVRGETQPDSRRVHGTFQVLDDRHKTLVAHHLPREKPRVFVSACRRQELDWVVPHHGALQAAPLWPRQDAPPAVPVCASRVSFNQNQAVRFTSRQHNL